MLKTYINHSYTHPYTRTGSFSVGRKMLRTRYQRRWRTILYLALAGLLTGIFCAWLLNNLISSHRHRVDTNGYSVVGKPTIDSDLINRVLERYSSPASGKGQALYEGGVKYGVDPAYALAFFMHESSFGTQGVATVTHSLGNIRATQGHPQYHGYRLYTSWEEGFDDWYRLIAQQYVGRWGLYTIDQIIPVYAPAADNNDEGAYIQSIKNAVDTWRSGSI